MTEPIATTPGLAQLAAAVAKVQARLPKLERDRTVEVVQKNGGTYSYSYVTLANLSDAVLPLLAEHGLSFITMPGSGSDGKMSLRYHLLHESGEILSGEFPISGDGGIQMIGGRITYARRYCLAALIGVAADEDDESHLSEGPAVAERRKPPASRATRSKAAPAEVPPDVAEDAPTAQRQRPAESSATAPGEWTQPMMRKWMAQNREAGITGDAVKAVAADMLGRQVESSKEITFDEMRRMIDAFEKALKDPDTAAATVIDIYQRTTGSASAPATAARRPAKRAAPAETRTVQEQTRDAVLGTPGPESVPWEGELPV